jgi:pre-mRNA-splicing helicase BRR2
LYLVHAEALVVEVVRNLNNCLEEYDGIKIIKLSEEPSLTCQQIQDSQVIVTTPEKWDIVTRKIQHHRIYTQNMKLLIMDEIHLHNDVLESIIARTKMHAKESTRLVGLSANCFNYEDVAKFLHIEAKGLFTFNDAYRHIPISQFLFGIKGEVQCQLQTMNHLCYEKVMAVDKENQILIFVHSREEAAKTARGIIDDAISNGTISRFRKEDSASRKILCTHTDIVMCNDLKYLLPYGLAIHNTNMSSEDCKVVEKLFAQGHLQVLVCDKDFAWGVNLSAHLVIVKGTQFYNPEKGAWTELSPLDVMQMLGHAGRPQRNSYCEGIIFTEHKELQYYHSLMKQQLPIESQFASKLADQLNSEVVLGSVQNVKEARHWIGYTYLYVCMLRDPNSYGLAPDILTSNITLEESKADLVSISLL